MRGYFGVGLYKPKHDHNVGQVLRAAHNHRASFVVVEAPRCSLEGAANTTRTHLDTPVFVTDDLLSIRPHGTQLVIVDLIPGAIDLRDFVHPRRALYVFGPEDGTLGRRHSMSAQHVIQIPTQDCMNLAACVNVVLYDRMLKESRPPLSTRPGRAVEPDLPIGQQDGSGPRCGDGFDGRAGAPGQCQVPAPA